MQNVRQLSRCTTPESVRGTILYTLDMPKYFARVHESRGWDAKDIGETQAQESFQFDGSVVLPRVERILGRKLKTAYFPAAYTGRVAKAIAECGCDVLASDLSDDWVMHLQSIGLRAEQRSFEELPPGKFDAMVTFEPYCIPKPLGEWTALLLLSRGLPYIEIGGDTNSFTSLSIGQQAELLEHGFLKRTTKATNRVRVNGCIDRFMRQYGAKQETYLMYGGMTYDDGKELFGCKIAVPTKSASRYASQDLRVLEQLLDCNKQDAPVKTIRLEELAEGLEMDIAETAGAIARLKQILNREWDLDSIVTYPWIESNWRKYGSTGLVFGLITPVCII